MLPFNDSYLEYSIELFMIDLEDLQINLLEDSMKNFNFNLEVLSSRLDDD